MYRALVGKAGRFKTCPYKKSYLISIFFKHCLGGGEACDRHTVRGTGNVIEAQVVAEFN